MDDQCPIRCIVILIVHVYRSRGACVFINSACNPAVTIIPGKLDAVAGHQAKLVRRAVASQAYVRAHGSVEAVRSVLKDRPICDIGADGRTCTDAVIGRQVDTFAADIRSRAVLLNRPIV